MSSIFTLDFGQDLDPKMWGHAKDDFAYFFALLIFLIFINCSGVQMSSELGQ